MQLVIKTIIMNSKVTVGYGLVQMCVSDGCFYGMLMFKNGYLNIPNR